MAFFRADVCLESPQSYSLEEKAAICEEMAVSMEAIDEAMRKDFQFWEPQAQARMLDLLEKADPDNFDWWIEVLIDRMPDSPDMLTKKQSNSKQRRGRILNGFAPAFNSAVDWQFLRKELIDEPQ